MKPQLLAGFPAGGLYPKESIARVGDEAAMRAPFLCLAVDIAECQLRKVSCSRRSLAAGVWIVIAGDPCCGLLVLLPDSAQRHQAQNP